MRSTCKYATNMKMVQIRNVPDALHRKLEARAAMEGMSLSDYLRVQIQAVANGLAPAELRQRLETRSRVNAPESVSRTVRAEREAR